MNCLVIKNDGVGDMVVVSGILAGLAKHFPGGVDLVTCKTNQDIARMIPGLRRCLYVSRHEIHWRPRWKRLGIARIRCAPEDREVFEHLRTTTYDVAISLRRYLRLSTVVLMNRTRARRRIALWRFPVNVSAQEARRDTRGWEDASLAQGPSHEIDYYRACLEQAMPDFRPGSISPMLEIEAGATSPAPSVSHKEVAIGMAGVSCNWPDAHWHRLINRLGEDGWRVTIFGGPDQQPFARRLAREFSHVFSRAGELGWHDTAAQLQRFDWYIGNDSGISHVASLACKHLLVILGGGTFGQYFPWPGSHHQTIVYRNMDCFGCNWFCIHSERFCLTQLQPETVHRVFREVVESRITGGLVDVGESAS